MAGVKEHTELDVWKLSDELLEAVDDFVARPAFNRRARLRDQLQSAAESPVVNIAEGFARFLPRDFAHFMRIAKASLTETIVHLGRARRLNLIEKEEYERARSLARRARGAAVRLIVYLESADPPGSRDGARGSGRRT